MTPLLSVLVQLFTFFHMTNTKQDTRTLLKDNGHLLHVCFNFKRFHNNQVLRVWKVSSSWKSLVEEQVLTNDKAEFVASIFNMISKPDYQSLLVIAVDRGGIEVWDSTGSNTTLRLQYKTKFLDIVEDCVFTYNPVSCHLLGHGDATKHNEYNFEEYRTKVFSAPSHREVWCLEATSVVVLRFSKTRTLCVDQQEFEYKTKKRRTNDFEALMEIKNISSASHWGVKCLCEWKSMVILGVWRKRIQFWRDDMIVFTMDAPAWFTSMFVWNDYLCLVKSDTDKNKDTIDFWEWIPEIREARLVYSFQLPSVLPGNRTIFAWNNLIVSAHRDGMSAFRCK